jgi:hypothetical protein
MGISDKLKAYLVKLNGEHDREYSWVHCNKYFHDHSPEVIKAERDNAALQLGFFLASWGMYRPTSFLFQHAYTVHRGIVDCILKEQFSTLWQQEFGAGANDASLIDLILKLGEGIAAAYHDFGNATNTLVTKVILGTMGCCPATDTFFNLAYKVDFASTPADPLDFAFVQNVLGFCQSHLTEFQSEQLRIEREHGIRYPVMKLVDMYFHQIGFELAKDDLKQRLGRYKHVKIGVVGVDDGISNRFVLDGDKLYLLPMRGSRTQWFKKLQRNPQIHIDARGEAGEFRATPMTDANAVKSVLDKFIEKYGETAMSKYSRLDVAVGVELDSVHEPSLSAQPAVLVSSTPQ